ncbi:MAG: hypothetical protein ACRENP_24650 [Longimicrobiales bacterium]
MIGDAALARRIMVNDLRLYFRNWQRKGWSVVGVVLLQLTILAFLHIPAFSVISAIAAGSPVPGGAEVACLCVSLFVFAAGLQRSLEALYNRGDLPLLLSSPVPARVVVVTRLSDILLTTLLSSAFIAIPLLNTAFILFGPAWLWGWLVWVWGVTLLAPAALWSTIVCVGRMGARRTRTVVQLISLLIGLVAIFLINSPSLTARATRTGSIEAAGKRIFEWFAFPPLSLVADAARGRALGLLALAAVTALVAWWAVRRLEAIFVSGAQAAASDLGGERRARTAPGTERRVWRGSFQHAHWRTLTLKELRLVRRDPLLVVRCFTQIIVLLPAMAGAFLYRTTTGFASFAFVGPAMMAVLLAGLMTANDEAAELVAASPLEPRQAIMARVAAAAVVPGVIAWILAAIVAALGAPLVGAITGLSATWLIAALSWLGACTTPHQSAEDRARNRPAKTTWQTFFAMLVGGLGAGAAALLLSNSSTAGMIMLTLSLGVGALSFLARPRVAG